MCDKILKSFLQYWNIKHITSISYNPQGQAITESSNRTLKAMFIKQRGKDNPQL